MRRIFGFIAVLLVLVFLASACSKQRYPYRRKLKKRDCDCPSWSYQKPVGKTISVSHDGREV